MVLRDALNEGIRILKTANNEAPALEAGVLLCHVIGRDKSFLYSHGEEELAADGQRTFFDYIKRRAGHTPLQYLISYQEFMSLDFIVTPDVLIPRQDTEILVEAVMQQLKGMEAGQRTPEGMEGEKKEIGNSEVQVLDLGTGSGCIAVSLAKYFHCCRVTAVDISCAALKVAGENAEKNGVADRVNFLQGSLFEAVHGRKFDVIVSNPPYIPESDIKGLSEEVRDHEPHSALDGGTDGLDFYRAITLDAHQYLRLNGLLAFEVGYDQAGSVSKLMMEHGFTHVRKIKDLAQIDRVVLGYLP